MADGRRNNPAIRQFSTDYFHQHATEWIQTIRTIHEEELFRDAASNEINDHLFWHLTQKDGGWGGDQIRAFVKSLQEWQDRHPVIPPKPPEPPFVPLDRLTAGSRMFMCGGQLYRWRSVSMFMLFNRFMRAEDIQPQIDWMDSVGADAARVFSMIGGLGIWGGWRLDPLVTPNYYLHLRDFFDWMHKRKKRVELTVLADCNSDRLDYDVAAQVRHINGCTEVAQEFPNVIIELANEPQLNGVRVNDLRAAVRRPGVLMSTGDYSPENGNLYCLDYGNLHPQRDNEWPRKAKDLYEYSEAGWPGFSPTHIPWQNGEPIGADEIDQPGKRSTNAKDFYDHGLVTALYGCGGTFHFQDGLYASVPRSTQHICAEAFFTALSHVPLEATLGQYTAGHLDNCPMYHSDSTALRTFARVCGDVAYVAVIRPTEAWTPNLRAGWKIRTQLGHAGNFLTLDRV